MALPFRSTRRAGLSADGECRVLWLTRGRQELALSVEGIWLRAGRNGEHEFTWSEIEQVQAVPRRGLLRQGVRIAVFPIEGGVHAVGPFPRGPAERWMLACAEAAAEHGERPLPLEGVEGFALAH